MAEIRQFDLGRPTAQAENILKSREQRRLSEALRPLQVQQNQQRVEQQDLKTNELQSNEAVREASILVGAFGDVSADPLVNQQKWDNALDQLSKANVDISDISPQFNPDQFESIRGVAQTGGNQQPVKSSVGAGVIIEIDDRQFFSNPVTDPITGNSTTALTPVDGGAPINVSPEQINQAVSSGQATISQSQPSGAPARIVSRSTGLSADDNIRQTRLEAEAKSEGSGRAKRRELFMTEGLAAADSIPVIKRALVLLDRVSTGGVQSTAGLAIKKAFGVEGPDEGELSANLGKAVLSQLRATFGAAFTEREGAKLDRIEAGFGKSTETNKRLLNQLMQMLEREARRGIAAAKEGGGDDFTISEIQESLDFEFKFEDEAERSSTPDQNSATITLPNGIVVKRVQ